MNTDHGRAVLLRLGPLLAGQSPGLVALSGGMDSSVLLAALVRAGRPVSAATFVSPLHHPLEKERAARLCRRLEVEHHLLEEDPFADARFTANTPERCYWCKRRRLARLTELAGRLGLEEIYDGSLASDSGGWRPGARALDEYNAARPMVAAGMDKDDVRAVGRCLGLEEWLQPASACLATRVEYNVRLTPEMIDAAARAEDHLARVLNIPFGSFRLRIHGSIARLELPPPVWARVMEESVRRELTVHLERLGFDYITLDLAGFVSGSMDRQHLK